MLLFPCLPRHRELNFIQISPLWSCFAGCHESNRGDEQAKGQKDGSPEGWDDPKECETLPCHAHSEDLLRGAPLQQMYFWKLAMRILNIDWSFISNGSLHTWSKHLSVEICAYHEPWRLYTMCKVSCVCCKLHGWNGISLPCGDPKTRLFDLVPRPSRTAGLLRPLWSRKEYASVVLNIAVTSSMRLT